MRQTVEDPALSAALCTKFRKLSLLHRELAHTYEQIAEALEDGFHDAEEDEREEAGLLALLEEASQDDRSGYLPGDVVHAIVRGAEPVRALRKARGLTQAQLSKTAQVGQGYLSQIERGERRGSLEVLRRLADALDAPIELLLPRREEEASPRA